MLWRASVSIHAPARGATIHQRDTTTGVKCFNPRAREGRDSALMLILLFFVKVSIHAPARGATRIMELRLQIASVSIHAPARGATYQGKIVIDGQTLFQSTRPRGARQYLRERGIDCYMFQSTRPRGARHTDTLLPWLVTLVSIHAPARGATCAWIFFIVYQTCFNPRAREGRDVS